jgi:hypothetical protein
MINTLKTEFIVHNILWHVDPLLSNDREISDYTTDIGYANRHEHNNSMANIALQWRSGVFYVVRAEML